MRGVTFLSVHRYHPRWSAGWSATFLSIRMVTSGCEVAQHGTLELCTRKSHLVFKSVAQAQMPRFCFSMGYGPDWLTGGAFGAEGSIITTLVLIVSLVIVYRLGERKEKFDD